MNWEKLYKIGFGSIVGCIICSIIFPIKITSAVFISYNLYYLLREISFKKQKFMEFLKNPEND